MTDNELKHLNRSELLEMLITATQENESLQAEIDRLKAQLEDRTIKYEKAGSLAEAAVLVSGVMEAAQNAADQYLFNIKNLSVQNTETVKNADEKAELMLTDAEKRAAEIEETAKKNAEKMMLEAKEKSEAYWTNVQEKIRQYMSAQQELQNIFSEKQG